MFPIAMSALPFKAEEMLTVSSGVEVPKATTVRPMTMGEIRNHIATEAAPSVKPLAPIRMRTSPPMRSKMSIYVEVLLAKIMILFNEISKTLRMFGTF